MLGHIRRNILRTAALASVAIGGMALLDGPAAWAQGTQSGVASINNPGGGAATSGDANTNPFFLNLPGTPQCPGDTNTGGYHVFSYAEPTVANGGPNPGEITYTAGGAPPAPGIALVDPNGNPFGPVNTNTATTTGGPGGVNQPSEFSWAPYVGSYSDNAADAAAVGNPLWAGDWNIGIACANGQNVTSNFWLATVTLGPPDANDDFTWTVDPPQSIPESHWAIALPLTAIAVIGGGIFALCRRRRHAEAAAA
jgi:hypothetical protein